MAPPSLSPSYASPTVKSYYSAFRLLTLFSSPITQLPSFKWLQPSSPSRKRSETRYISISSVAMKLSETGPWDTREMDFTLFTATTEISLTSYYPSHQQATRYTGRPRMSSGIMLHFPLIVKSDHSTMTVGSPPGHRKP